MGIYLSALIQAGDILLPQAEEFGGPKPTIVPVGVDQDPHIRFTSDLAAKLGDFFSPSSTLHKLIKSLNGSAKMSKRDPKSYFITLKEEPEVIAKKISNAFTGGRPTAEEQHRLGANPDICPIYDLYLFHFYEKDEDVAKLCHEECLGGGILWGECKSRLIEIVTRFVKDHRRKRHQYIDKARDILEAK